MDRLKEMKLDEPGLRPDVARRIGEIANSVRSRGVGAYNRWESSQPELKPAPSQQRHDIKSLDEFSKPPHEPKVVQLNLKSTLMGVRILDDDEELFFSQQSSMSSMLAGGAVPFKWESKPGKPIEQPKTKVDNQPWTSPLTLPPDRSGSLRHSQPLSALSGRSTKTPSGLLYPCPNPGSRPNSSKLNAAHFTFDDHNLLTKDMAAGTSGGDNIEKIFKKLVGQSRLQQCTSSKDARSDFIIGGNELLSDSPVSILDCLQSPTSSERSFRGKSTRKSLRRRSEDANLVATGAPTLRPKSQLAEYLTSITALTEDAMDGDDLEGPSEVAWLEPDDKGGYTASAQGKEKPLHERWSSNSSSWNLSLVPKPLRMVNNRKHHQHATVPGRSGRKSTGRRGKVDSIMPISLSMSYDGGTARSRTVRKSSTRSELNSGRSWWPDLGSGRKSSLCACSGRLQMEVAAEPDLHEPDMEQANNVKTILSQQDARAKVDEEDFPFDNPIASSFVFQEAAKTTPSFTTAREQSDTSRVAALHIAVVSVVDSETTDELQFSDNYLDPEDGSISDSDGSQGSEWVSSRSFKDLRDMVDGIGFSGSLVSGLSARALSGYLDFGRSGRFSVDLQRGQKLDKAQHPRTPDVRLRMFKSEKSLKRSILSPCLPFLHRSHNKNVPRIQQAPVACASSRRLQPVNSFTARLGPVAENSTLAAHFQLQ